MTDEDKSKRRERIERVAEHRKNRTMTVWISRNSDAGDVPVGWVDIWLVHPVRKRYDDGSVAWVMPGGDPDAKVDSADGHVRAYFGRMTLEQCLKQFRVYPDDSLQLIKDGNEPEPKLVPSVPETVTLA